ncbi:MAG: hypothetical protein Q8O03_04420 [Nanoarchaeota archaeon]|nr:hypothetical protein [Nanoarchaeota archaeon]
MKLTKIICLILLILVLGGCSLKNINWSEILAVTPIPGEEDRINIPILLLVPGEYPY